MSEMLWVACPGGRLENGTNAVLRVVVVPRLTAELADTGFADWPAQLKGLTPVIQARPGMAEPVPVAPRHGSDSNIWRTFFEDTTVQPFIPADVYGLPDVTPSTNRNNLINDHYKDVATDLAEKKGQGDGATHKLIRRHLSSWESMPTAVAPIAVPPDEVRNDRADFHRIASLLREHPSVMWALGLTFDLVFSADVLPQPDSPVPAVPPAVRVFCPGTSIPIVSPWTRYELGAKGFFAASTDTVRAGMLDLAVRGGDDNSAAVWDVATVDIDGAVLRLGAAARAGRDNGSHVVPEAEGGDGDADGDGPTGGAAASGPGLPGLRSAGLALLHGDRAGFLSRRLEAAAGRAGDGALAVAELDADDLTLGYRFDIQIVGQNTWYSLCRRITTYRVGDTVIGLPRQEEEGHVKPFTGRMSGNGEMLPGDEVVTRWNGWSLAVSPPTFGGLPEAARRRATQPSPFGFSWDPYEVPAGSLPKLRYGQNYYLRGRVVDMAGGGLTVTDADDDGASQARLYRRWDPVPPPLIPPPAGAISGDGRVTPAGFGPAGAADRLVVRSGSAAGPTPTYPDTHLRALLPPPVSVAVAEYHGSFDQGTDEETWALLGRAMATTEPLPAGPDGSATYGWLADPGSAGVALHLVPAPATVGEARHALLAWKTHDEGGPVPLPKLLTLIPVGQGEPAGLRKTSDRSFEVSLPPAGQATLRVSSFVSSTDLDSFVIFDMVGEHNSTVLTDGLHPMLTPAVKLTLVHAVRAPVTPDAARMVCDDRSPADTFVDLRAESDSPPLGIDSASTVQLDVDVTWTEPVDRLDVSGPRLWPCSAHVQSVPIGLADDWQLAPIRHEFADTRHRTVTYHLTALSRFRSYFDAGELEEDFQRTDSTTVVVPSSARPPAPVVTGVVPAFHWDSGETTTGWSELRRTRRGGLVRVELDRPWLASGEGEQLAVLVSPTGSAPTNSDALEPYLSLALRDPIRATPDPVAVLGADRFPGAAPPVTVCLAETALTVSALPYDVAYDGSHWYADIAVDTSAMSAYCPFVRLVLARYQRNSLRGLELSTVARAEMAPLLPERTLTVYRDGETVQITLRGLGPEAPHNVVRATLEICLHSYAHGAATALTCLDDDDLGSSFAGWSEVQSVVGGLNEPLGQLTVPTNRSARLVIREIEPFPASASSGGTTNFHFPYLDERVVFLDVVPLPV